jgi:hypothetical protein
VGGGTGVDDGVRHLGEVSRSGYVVGMPAHRRLQVFISSTYTDLKEERQAAVEAVLAAGHIPAGMELFAAGSKSQLDTIKKWIDESDVYMLVLGHRYGSIEPESKKSYTHVEYDYAITKGKPFFAVIATDDWRLAKQGTVKDPNSLIELEHPKELKKFRDLVGKKMCKMVDDKKDIKLAVHESLREIERGHHLVGWVRGDAIEREAELTKEIAALNRQVAASEKRAEKAESLSKAAAEPDWKPIYDSLANKYLDAKKAFPAERLKSMEPALQAVFSNYPALSCLRFWKNSLLLGVSNAYGASAEELFLYGRVVPPLLAHDLVEKGKVPARMNWTRYQLSPKGRAFLNWCESALQAAAPSKTDTETPE